MACGIRFKVPQYRILRTFEYLCGVRSSFDKIESIIDLEYSKFRIRFLRRESETGNWI